MRGVSIKYILLFSFLWLSCSERGRLEQILSLSGEHRKELEAVIRHYEGDTLKQQAVCFLIENMLGKGTIEYRLVDSCGNGYSLTALSAVNIDSLYSLMRDGQLESKQAVLDLRSISAAYLIENVDLAFEVWRKYSWCKHLSFEDFCYQILPYRLKQEPLDRWRSFYYQRYKAIADSLSDAGATRSEVVDFFNTHYGKKYIQEVAKISVDLPLLLIEHLGGGTCDHLALNAVQLFRAIGIPMNLDLLPYHGKVNGGHAYNSYVDESGDFHFFSPYEREVERTRWTAPLVLRVCYELQPELSLKANEWNALLVNRHLRNVTEKYYKTFDLSVPVNTEDTLLFLATYNRGDFKVVVQGHVENSSVRYPMLVCGLLYFPMIMDGRQLRPVGQPFIVSDTGKMEYIFMNHKEVDVDGVKLYDASKVLKLEDECYTLYYWNDGWCPVREAISTDSETLNFGRIPINSLFLVRGETALGRMQRPFLVKEGECVYY